MNNVHIIIMLAAAILTLLASSAFAIQCWDCSSYINPGCGDPFRNDSFAKIDCDQIDMPHLQGQKATLCRKIIQKVHGDDVPRVIRGCGWIVDDSVNKDCVSRSSAHSYTSQICTCDQEGCNGSSSLSAALISSILIACGLVTCIRRLV